MKEFLSSLIMRQSLRFLLLICASTFVVANANAATAVDVELKAPWIREAPPNAKMLAAYFTITNNSKQAKTLKSISCNAFEKVEMHKTVKKGNMSSMVEQKELLLKAGESVKFSPGSYHLMLIHPKSAIKSGQHHDMTLHFADKSTVTISFPVKKGQGMDEHMSMHGDHSMDMNGHDMKDHDMHDM